MSDFFKNYEKEFEEEFKRFAFLSSAEDAHLLIYKHTRIKLDEYVRLATILIVFGFRRLFFRLAADVEKFFDEFMQGIIKIDGNLPLIDEWINDFIEKIRYKEAQQLSRELWKARKTEASAGNFSLKKLWAD